MVHVAPETRWGGTPRQSVERECARRGEDAVVAGCVALLHGSAVDAEPVDGDLVMALGGPPAAWVETGNAAGPDYWLRVWAARGLLYAWRDFARRAVGDALGDDAWRVREAALRVVTKRGLSDQLATVETLLDDDATRVRAAATRVLKRL